MKRSMVVLALLACFGFSEKARASSSESVGLGVALGVAFPDGDLEGINVENWDANFNWGFFVNIPLIYTFHLTPSAELYKIGEKNATDISLAFKFIINLWKLDIFVGVVPGITSVDDLTAINIGGLCGLSFNLFANLNFFVQAKYKAVLQGDHNSKVMHMNAGVLFAF